MIFLVRVIQRGNVVTDHDWSFDNPTESHDWSQFDTDNDFCSAFQSLSLTTLHGWWLTIKQHDQLFLPGSNLSRYFLFLFSSSMYPKSSAVFRWNVGKSNQWYRIWQQNSHSCCGHKIRGDLLWNYNSPCNVFLNIRGENLVRDQGNAFQLTKLSVLITPLQKTLRVLCLTT